MKQPVWTILVLFIAVIGVSLTPMGIGEVRGEENMVLIPFGEFTMGHGEHYDEASHPVVLTPYYIDKYEVSNKAYGEFMRATGHAAPAYWDDKRYNKPNHPVVGVNWYDATAFCEWKGMRLPTEAEWEKAARGPGGHRVYPWGNEFDRKKLNCCAGGGAPAPVDSYPEGSSGYGVFHMSGNVYEWVQDWYDPKYYSTSPALNPKGPQKGYNWGALGEMKVIRGGSWFAPKSSQHSTHRFWNQPENNSYGIGLGFRCAMDAPEGLMEKGQMAFMQALINMGGEKPQNALASIEEALEISPNNPEYLELRDEIRKQVRR